MVFRPEVFVSATFTELDPYRAVVKETLRAIGAEPIEHTDLNVAYGPLDGLLQMKIGQCDAVIHLTGFVFGPEPPDRTHGAPRRSLAQFEFDVSQSLAKKTFCFVAEPGTLVNPGDPGDDEARMIHGDFRRLVQKLPEHWTFNSPEDLARKITVLRSRLMVRRRFIRLPFGSRKAGLPGRERLLNEMEEAVKHSPVVVLHPPAQFASMSMSAGKTAAAVELGWRLYEARAFDFVFHLPASSRGEIETALAALARMDALGLVHEEVSGHRARLGIVRQWLADEERRDRVLVILDGVDSEVTWWAVKAILPWFARAKVIVTSRLPLVWPDSTQIAVGSISTEAAVELLAAGKTPSPQETESLARLARTLGCQPLALIVASRQIAERKITADQIIQSLNRSSDSNPEGTAPKVIRWQPHFARLVREALTTLDHTAKTFLHVLVCLGPQPSAIPQALFAGRPDATQTRGAMLTLERQGLIQQSDDGQAVLVHRLVREVVRDRMTPEQMASGLDAARALIDAAMPRSERSLTGATTREQLVPHCLVLLGQLNGHPLEIHAAHLARSLAGWLRDCGRLSEAEHFQRRAVRIVEKEWGHGHAEVAKELRGLAQILRDLHRYSEAENLHRQAAAGLERQMPASAHELVSELYGLATCLRVAGKMAKAREVLEQALAIEERQSGRAHLRTGIAVHALAMLLEVMNEPEAAAEYYRRALEIDEHAQISSPARISVRLQNLATALAAGDRRREALDCMRRGMEIDFTTYGPGHMELVLPLIEYACLMEEEYGVGPAEEAWRQAVNCAEGAIGPAHPDLAVALVGLASVCRELGKAEESHRLVIRAAEMLPDPSTAWHPLDRSLIELCKIAGGGVAKPSQLA